MLLKPFLLGQKKFLPRIFTYRLWSTKIRQFSSNKNEIKYDVDLNKPISYTKSPAAKWKAEISRSGHVGDPSFWFEPYVLIVSISVFLIYFCILREENDVDEELGKSLYDRINGLEEKQLLLSLQYNQDHNIDTTNIKERLNEIAKDKK